MLIKPLLLVLRVPHTAALSTCNPPCTNGPHHSNCHKAASLHDQSNHCSTKHSPLSSSCLVFVRQLSSTLVIDAEPWYLVPEHPGSALDISITNRLKQWARAFHMMVMRMVMVMRVKGTDRALLLPALSCLKDEAGGCRGPDCMLWWMPATQVPFKPLPFNF